MKEEKGKWEDIIHSKMYDFEAETNPNDWDILSAKLSGEKTVALHPFRKYGYAAAAAVAALLIVGGLYFFPHEDKEQEQMAVVEKTVDNVLKTDGKPVDEAGNTVEKAGGTVEKTVSKDAEAVEKTVRLVDKSTQRVEKFTQDTEKSVDNATDEPPVHVRPLPLERNETEADFPKINVEKIEQEMLYGYNEIMPEDVNLQDERLTADASTEVKRRRWSFGMGGGGYAASSSSSAASIGTYSALFNNYEQFFGQQVIHLRNVGQAVTSDEVISEKNLDYTDYLSGEVKHKTPISAGLGISYHLNERWSLQSGAVYTMLRSKGNYNDNAGNAVKWKQNLHYIGVPLSVSYQIAEWNRFQWYALGGGMCEFNVSGKVKKTIEVEGMKATENENLRMKTPMWSLNARTGVIYPIWKFIHVYAEAGASYYFDNHSKIETIRSDKPFNVSLQAGIRLGF